VGHKKINFCTVLVGQAVGIKEIHDDIWLISFMDYDLRYLDLETRVLEPLDNDRNKDRRKRLFSTVAKRASTEIHNNAEPSSKRAFKRSPQLRHPCSVWWSPVRRVSVKTGLLIMKGLSRRISPWAG